MGHPVSYHSEAAGFGHTSREKKSMTKADLIEQVARTVGPRITKGECGLMVDAFLDAVKDALARSDHIERLGFGTFKVRQCTARTGRNPRTGEAVEVPARDVPVFIPSRHSSTAGWNETQACLSRESPWGAGGKP